MREFAKISPQIWTNELGRKIKSLGLEARIVSLYLQSSPYSHMTGVYYMPIVLIAHEAGVSVEQAKAALDSLCQIGFCSYDYDYEYVWVHGMGIEQVAAQLKPNDNRIKAINNHYASLPKLSFLQDAYSKYAASFYLNNHEELISPQRAPSESLRSKEKEKEKENNNEKENQKKNILSGEPDGACEKNLLSFQKQTHHDQKKLSASYLSQATDILNFLNDKTKCRFRHEESNLKLIVARLKSGASVDECRAVIARKYRDWNGTDMQKYLRPATLFNAIKFEQYLGECVIETTIPN